MRALRLTRALFTGSAKYRHFSGTATCNMPAKVGDKFPSVDLYENDPGTIVKTGEEFSKGKHVIFTVPGAFTPGCSKTHLPGYVEQAETITKKGYSVNCVSVNDPFVMAAWGADQKCEGKVRMLADTNGKLTEALDLSIDLTGPLGNTRCKRVSMVVVDGTIKAINVEPDGTGLSCSLADNIMEAL